MKVLFALVLSLVFSAPLFAETRAGLDGSTQAEREIRWAWKYLREFTQSCVSSSTECQDPDLKKVVTSLNEYLPTYDSADQKKWSQLLHFVSEKDRPDLFQTTQGEIHRIAVTGLQKYADVYINTDRMNLALEDWVGILAHESVHHLGFQDDTHRLPDLVGAEISKHFRKRIQSVSLEQFNLPQARNLVFNSQAPLRLTVGLMSWSGLSFDVEWGATPLVPLCQPGETVTREFVGLTHFRINRIQPKTAVVSLRSGGFVNIECSNSTNGTKTVRRQLINGGMELQYKLPLNLDQMDSEVPQVISKETRMGPSDNPADAIDSPNQSFWVQSIHQEKPSLAPAEKWKTQIVVYSTDGYQPQTCQIYFTGLKWSFWKQENLPAEAMFDTCSIKPLGNNQFQLDGEYLFPADLQSDNFNVTLILFKDPAGDRMALPAKPVFVRVENPKSLPAAQMNPPQILDLPSLAKASDEILTSSYQASDDQVFRVQIPLIGQQTLSDVQVDLDLRVFRPGGYQMVWFNGPILDMPVFFQKVESSRTAEGTLVTLTMKMATNLSGYPIMALRLSRIYMRTSDFSWVEHELINPEENWIFNKRYLP